MIDTEYIPSKIQIETSINDDGALQVTVSGEPSNWVMKRFEKIRGFVFRDSMIDPATKKRRVIFSEIRAGDDDWVPFTGELAQVPGEALMWQDDLGDFYFGVAGRDAGSGEEYVQSNGGEKTPLAKMVAWRRKPAAYRPQENAVADEKDDQ